MVVELLEIVNLSRIRINDLIKSFEVCFAFRYFGDFLYLLLSRVRSMVQVRVWDKFPNASLFPPFPSECLRARIAIIAGLSREKFDLGLSSFLPLEFSDVVESRRIWRLE